MAASTDYFHSCIVQITEIKLHLCEALPKRHHLDVNATKKVVASVEEFFRAHRNRTEADFKKLCNHLMRLHANLTTGQYRHANTNQKRLAIDLDRMTLVSPPVESAPLSIVPSSEPPQPPNEPEPNPKQTPIEAKAADGEEAADIAKAADEAEATDFGLFSIMMLNPSTENAEECTHQRALLLPHPSDPSYFYLEPGETLSHFSAATSSFADFSGFPSQANTLDEYKQLLQNYPRETLNPDSIVNNLLSDLAINKPGTSQVVLEDCKDYLPSQAEVDLTRIRTISINEQTVYDLDKTTEKISPTILFDRLAYALENKTLAFHLSKLITQATLADMSIRIFHRLFNLPLNIRVGCSGYSITLFTKTASDLTGSLVFVQITAQWRIERIEEETLGYLKTTRMIELPRENIVKGLSEGAKVTDDYSSIFATVEETENHNLPIPANPPLLHQDVEEEVPGSCILS